MEDVTTAPPSTDPDGSAFCENASAAVVDILRFNFSEYDYPGEGPWPPPLGAMSALKIIFCIVNMVASILGNTAVIIAVYHNPALRSTINFYLVRQSFPHERPTMARTPLNAITRGKVSHYCADPQSDDGFFHQLIGDMAPDEILLFIGILEGIEGQNGKKKLFPRNRKTRQENQFSRQSITLTSL